jgi:cobalt-zinc-cadmium efflux system membrane fusion protein
MSTPSAPIPGAAARRGPAWRKAVQIAVNWIVLGVIVLGVAYFLRSRQHDKESPTTEPENPPVQLAQDLPDTLELSPQTVQAMGVQAVAVRAAPASAPLRLFGSLFLEGNRLVHVQTRFAGMVHEVGATHEQGDGSTRSVRPGDQVSKGQVLAKLWSKEVGEKKSELVNSISKLRFWEAVVERFRRLPAGGVVSLKEQQEAERNYQDAFIQVESCKRTLRSWLIPEEELARIQAEAERIIKQSRVQDNPQAPTAPASRPEPAPLSANPPLQPMKPSEQLELDRTWAEIDILAPMAGVILEKNFTVGDIVDTSLDMFKIADLSRLGVMVNVYEEDLPKLVALPPEQRHWKLELMAEPGAQPHEGIIETIGNVIDPSQHTAVVKGWIDNPKGQLRVGQFVTAIVDLPNREGLVSVPLSSIKDDGSRTFVFISADKSKTKLTLREVKLARRGSVMAQLESQPTNGYSPESHPKPVEVGELVVTSGALELAEQLHKLQTQHPVVAVETQPGTSDSETGP